MTAPAPKSDSTIVAVRPPNFVRRFFRTLGPGVITGAADDDPSGIATYSIAGAQLGTSLLWTALLTWPLMSMVQMMCARVGMVTGRGLAGALRRKFDRRLVLAAALALLAANTINIGADLAGMADAAEMLTGLGSHWFVVVFGIAIACATIWLRYHQIASTLKWLCLVLFAYVITAFVVHPNWSAAIHDTFAPSWPKGHVAWQTLVAILGTTISPYLFFWQASQEVEEEKAKGRRMRRERQGATKREIISRRMDVGVGAFFAVLIMYFIMLTTASTLHRHGVTSIETSRQAAEVLGPLAGRFAALLYTLGILGVGFLAIPTLSGSAAYALAETLSWKEGLDEKLNSARAFYGVIIVSTAAGIALDFLNINPVRALFWTAVINGLLAPFLLAGLLVVASNKTLMMGQPSSILSRVLVAATILIMFGAAFGMFVL
jgi:NRAMP (natural resistance-associated macrophage protein)-like metal ion transporter